MTDLWLALCAPKRQLRLLLALWLAQIASAILIALPVIRAAAPLLDEDFLEAGGMMLSELILIERQALLESLGLAVFSGAATFLLLGVLRYEMTRRIAQDCLDASKKPVWWHGAGLYYGIGFAKGAGLAFLGWGLVQGAVQFYRDTLGTLPPQPTLGAALVAALVLVGALFWITACDMARISLFLHEAPVPPQTTAKRPLAERWIFPELRMRLPKLAGLKAIRLLLLLAQTWLVLELTSPGGSLVGLGALGCTIAVQLLVFAALWLDAAWIGYIARKLNRASGPSEFTLGQPKLDDKAERADARIGPTPSLDASHV